MAVAFVAFPIQAGEYKDVRHEFQAFTFDLGGIPMKFHAIGQLINDLKMFSRQTEAKKYVCNFPWQEKK